MLTQISLVSNIQRKVNPRMNSSLLTSKTYWQRREQIIARLSGNPIIQNCTKLFWERNLTQKKQTFVGLLLFLLFLWEVSMSLPAARNARRKIVKNERNKKKKIIRQANLDINFFSYAFPGCLRWFRFCGVLSATPKQQLDALAWTTEVLVLLPVCNHFRFPGDNGPLACARQDAGRATRHFLTFLS